MPASLSSDLASREGQRLRPPVAHISFLLAITCLVCSCALFGKKKDTTSAWTAPVQSAPPEPPKPIVVPVSFKIDSNPQGAAVYSIANFQIVSPQNRNNAAYSWVGLTPCEVTYNILSTELSGASIKFITALPGYEEQKSMWVFMGESRLDNATSSWVIRGDTNIAMFHTLQPTMPLAR